MSSLSVRLGNGKYGIIGIDSAEKLVLGIFNDTEELRLDIPMSLANGASYKGLALKNSATSASVWDVMKITYDTNGNPTRYQIQNAIVWDSRTAGW